ncbi:uncharacterized protein N7487_002755 [Penicillium crustosum]|uniref:uncharacterized protein n=1 Tax=Penicillium crustosum TaxID=36656 RepID=UPI002386D2D8|nr:uncharacterized protein N7487_002755 [Penicillium crustosum]KAJ5419205.1 hypothetical protein N7487_002755 [Penicillium crustosum]
MGNLNLLIGANRWQTHLLVGGDSKIDLTSALIFGCRASGKLRELWRALGLFCPAKSPRGSPPASFTATIIRGQARSLTLSLFRMLRESSKQRRFVR